MRFLISGDLHLGRRSTRLPAHVADASAADAWGRAVDVAMAHDVDAVLLSGDLIDQDNRFFEALGPLEQGVRRLHTAGIRVVAVAGNHDHDTLPALVNTLPAGLLTLLGVGGRWEQLTLTSRHDGSRVHLLGWSFPSRTVRVSPIESLPPLARDGIPTVALLHGDLDAAASVYAPLAGSALARVPVSAWVLGHIHAGGLRAHAPPVLYPGSPQPLDPGEPGVHGVWLADVSHTGVFESRLVPVATVHYDTVAVELAGCDAIEDARGRVVRALRAASTRVQREGLQHAALRVHFVGRTVLHGRLAPLAQQLRDVSALASNDEADIDVVAIDASGAGVPSLSVTHVHDATTPDHGLATLDVGTDAIAVLARLRRAVDRDGLAALPEVLRESLQRTPREVASARMFEGVIETTMPDAALVEVVRAQLDRLLDALLAQRSPDRGRGAT